MSEVTESVYELARESPSLLSNASIMSLNNSTIITKKSSVINCTICLSNILDPACLSCGHKFCEKCLEGYWDAKDRPDIINCPLCRRDVCTVKFTKKEPKSSTVDFRKAFNGLEHIPEEGNPSISCFKFSIIVPAVYYLLKYIITELMSFLQIEIGYRVL